MARDLGPKCRVCRREGMKLFLKGERCLTEKCAIERRSYPPGEHGRGRIKQSEYLLQLREKQKARRYYGLLEKQFRNYYVKATRGTGAPGENLLRMLETRLDNVVYRLGFARTRRQARQLVTHGHVLVNERVSAIPSHQLRPGDLLGSGTVGGGCLLEIREGTIGRYLEPDDEVVLRIERLGELRSPIIARP